MLSDTYSFVCLFGYFCTVFRSYSPLYSFNTAQKNLKNTCQILRKLLFHHYIRNKKRENMKNAKRMMLMLVMIIQAVAGFADDSQFKEGDIVFQISKSKQSPYIQLATASVWSHCGIVIEKGRELYVLEASNVVKLTPLYDWIDKGRYGTIKTRRVIDKPVKIQYRKYLGRPYDLAFRLDNNKMYCSELVYTIYKEQFGIELCKPRKVSSYHTIGLSKMMKKRGISPNQLVVAPSDLL